MTSKYCSFAVDSFLVLTLCPPLVRTLYTMSNMCLKIQFKTGSLYLWSVMHGHNTGSIFELDKWILYCVFLLYLSTQSTFFEAFSMFFLTLTHIHTPIDASESRYRLFGKQAGADRDQTTNRLISR